MYIRCPACKACTRIVPGNLESGATCASCGADYSLKQADSLGKTPMERAARADTFARSEGIELASAYSVLLGIMPRSDAIPSRAGFEDVLAPEAEAQAYRPSLAGKRLPFDPAFRDAVARGFLSTAQAAARGDRVIYASRVAQKHRLSSHEAFLIADNRLQLSTALEQRSTAQARAAAREKESPNRMRLTAALLLVILAGGLAFWHRQLTSADELEAGLTRPDGRSPAETRMNAGGELTSVTARDARSVLEAFCKSSLGVAAREPVRVVPGRNGAKLGIFREHGALYAIKIREQAAKQGWTAGDGREPILVLDAAPGSPVLSR